MSMSVLFPRVSIRGRGRARVHLRKCDEIDRHTANRLCDSAPLVTYSNVRRARRMQVAQGIKSSTQGRNNCGRYVGRVSLGRRSAKHYRIWAAARIKVELTPEVINSDGYGGARKSLKLERIRLRRPATI